LLVRPRRAIIFSWPTSEAGFYKVFGWGAKKIREETKKKPLRKRAAKKTENETAGFLLFLGGGNASFWQKIIGFIWWGVLGGHMLSIFI
jgi:hypothetical protein